MEVWAVATAYDLFEITECLFLDGREAALEIALRRLRVGKIVGLVGLDHFVLISLPKVAMNFSPASGVAARALQMCSAPVISDVSPNTP